MADWLKNPWIEKAICSFYDKDATQPASAKAQIIQFNKIPCEKSASAEALLSDKWMYVKSIFTPQAIEEFEKSPQSEKCGLTLCDIKGGLIFLKEYKVVPHVDYPKGVWEHLLIVNKFSLKCSGKNSQFGSELINSAAHLPFQVRIKKHFQLKQLTQLLYRDKDTQKLKLKDNKAFDVKAITNSFVERHQFVFIPDEQQQQLDDIPEWRSNFSSPSTVDASNSLNTSLPSNQQVQNDVSLSPKTHQSDDQNEDHQPSTSGFNAESNNGHYSLKEPSSSDGSFGLADSCDGDGTYAKVPDHMSPEMVQRSPHSTGESCALEQHLELPPSQVRTKLTQLLYRDKDTRKLKLKDNKAFDVKAITNSFVERHQFVFIPDEQQQQLDNIPEWNNDFCPPSAMDASNSLNTSLPSNQKAQDDVSMSPKTHQSEDQSEDHQSFATTGFITGSNDLHYSLNDLPARNGTFGLDDSCDGDGRYVKIPDCSSSSLEAVQASPTSIGVNNSLERHLELSKSGQPCCLKSKGGSLGNKNKTKGKNKKETEKRLSAIDVDIDGSQSLNEGSLMSERRPVSTVAGQLEQNSASELAVQPPSSAYATFLDILDNLDHQSDPFFCNSRPRNRDSVGDVVEENEEVENWTQATNKDKQVRRSSIELALAKQMKKQGEWLDRCSQVEASFNESSLSLENFGNEENAESGQEYGAIFQNVFQQGNSTTKDEADVSRFWLEFSQSQPLETRELDDTGDECMGDIAVGDQVEIVVDDNSNATNDSRKRFVKKVFSLSKGACHSLVTSVETQVTKSFQNEKEGDKTTVEGLESREQSRNHPEVDFSSVSDMVCGSGKFSSSPGNGWDENMKGVNMEKCEKSLSVAAKVVQSLKRPEKTENGQKNETNSSRGMTPVPTGNVDLTNNQELSKKSKDTSHKCNLGELSTSSVVDEQNSSCSEVSFILNTISDDSSSSGQKSDESFSILNNISISDLTPDGFKPAFTSTEQQASPSANRTQTLLAKETRKDLPREEGNHTSTKKHVTFGKSTIFSDKHYLEESLQSNTTSNAASPHNNDPFDENSIIPCTQQEDDSELMTFQDPLQILRAMPPSITKISQGDPKSRVLGCHATSNGSHDNGASQHYTMDFVDQGDAKRSYEDYNSDASRGLVGNLRQKKDKWPKDDARRRQDHDRHAVRLASRNSNATRQHLENANDVNFQASITGDDNEIVLCSDESEELLHSPTLVAKDTVMQCIKQSRRKFYDGIVLDSEDSPNAVISSSPKTAAKQNILQCIKQKSNDDSRADVTGTLSQSRQTSALPLRRPEIENTGRESLQFSLSDSQLTRAFNLPAEKENTSLLRSKKRANSKERKSPQEGECAVSKTSVRTTSLGTILTSPFYKTTKSNSNNEKPPEDVLRSTGCDVNMMSHPVDTNEEAECLIFDPAKGLETSSVRVTLVSHEPAKVPRRNEESNHEANKTRNTKHVSRRQIRTQLSKEKNNAKGEQEENQTVKKRRKLQDCISSTTVVTSSHKITTPRVNLEDGYTIPVKNARDVNKVSMEAEISSTSAMSSEETNLERGQGRLKRKRSQEDKNRAAKKLTTSAPSTTSAPGLNTTKKDKNERVLNECDSSQDLSQYSCKHMLYSQQDPLILEFSSSENSDQDFSQESNIRDLLSSPILLPSPPHETKTVCDFPLKVPKSTETGMSNARCPETDEAMEDSYDTEEQESSSPKFVSLPSYQVRTTKKENCFRLTNKQEDTTHCTSTSRGKTKPFIISDSEDDENENSFCWFSPW